VVVRDRKTAQSLRRWERYQVKIRTRITLNLNGDTLSFSGEASDVSQGGLSLFIPRELEPGTALRMEFSLPYTSRAMVIRGIVRSRHEFTYGVEFIGATQHQQQTIAQVCKTLQILQ